MGEGTSKSDRKESSVSGRQRIWSDSPVVSWYGMWLDSMTDSQSVDSNIIGKIEMTQKIIQ